MKNSFISEMVNDIFLSEVVRESSENFEHINFSEAPLYWISETTKIARSITCSKSKPKFENVYGTDSLCPNMLRELFCQDFSEVGERHFCDKFLKFFNERDDFDKAWSDTEKLIKRLRGKTCFSLLAFEDWSKRI